MDARLRGLLHDDSERSQRVTLVARRRFVLIEYQDAHGDWVPLVHDAKIRDVVRQYRMVRRTTVSRWRTRRTQWRDGKVQ